jgi:hypothetical protein
MKYFLLLLHSNYLNQTLAVGSLDLGRGDILSVVAKGYRWAGRGLTPRYWSDGVEELSVRL